MMQGYDLDLIREVSQAVSIPVIASGGCGFYEHMLQAFKAGADACAAGAMFAFTDQTPKGAAMYLKNNGLEVRL
jgi:cyclase